jgi:phage/plasmid-like protein (TIGR03299 family)
MSHELTIRADQSAEMAYVGDVPWHGLGQQLAHGATIEQWQSAAGMDWRIQRSLVRYFCDREGATQIEMPEQHVLFRSDNKTALGIVSAKYKPVQPTQVLEFFRDLVEGQGFALDTAGTLFGGRKFWALAKINENAEILERDPVTGYLLLTTSADGSSATVGKFLATRVVCNNTLTAGMRERTKQASVSHRQAFSASALKDKLGLAHDGFAQTVEGMRKLTQVRMAQREAAEFVRQLLRPAEVKAEAAAAAAIAAASGSDDFAALLQGAHVPKDDAEDTKRAPKGEAEILRLFAGGAIGDCIPGVHGTAWGMLNAVTEYVDHHASTKTDSHRMDSAWSGRGEDLKLSAFEQLLQRA